MRALVLFMGACLFTLSLASTPAWAQQPGNIRLGQISLSFYAVTAGVVQEVLERLGHTVEVSTGSHGQIFPRLGAGEVDLLVAAWLPHGHAVYWQKYGPQALELGVLYEGARFAWMVPTYVPEEVVDSVVDLIKPEVAVRMEKVIQGTGRDSGNMMLSAQVMQAYGLGQAGYRLQPGTLADFQGAYDHGIASQRWFVMPLWFPHYINRLGNMRPIDEPQGLLGPAATARWWRARPGRRRHRRARCRFCRASTSLVRERDGSIWSTWKRAGAQAARRWLQRRMP